MRWLAPLLAAALLAGCEAAPQRAAPLVAQDALSAAELSSLVERISESGGYFDTDNLISNEEGYLKVIDALREMGVKGGAYVGVGPDQNYSYIAAVQPAVAFITDVRRDNLLHHLLLKALIERAPTRVEFLSGLHGVAPPADAASWRDRDIEEIVRWVDESDAGPEEVARVERVLRATIEGFGIELSEDDHDTIRRFHRTFVDAGLDLRFTSFGRPPRPYYPTYRQLVLETDFDGDRASYLATAEAYEGVRELHLANRIIPVVGDLAGTSALSEMGEVMREMDVELTAVYVSNVEFYLWRARSFERWIENLRSLPLADGAVVIRSYFPNAGGRHPSSVPGYYATQSLQPVEALLERRFTSYWDVVTTDVVELAPR